MMVMYTAENEYKYEDKCYVCEWMCNDMNICVYFNACYNESYTSVTLWKMWMKHVVNNGFYGKEW